MIISRTAPRHRPEEIVEGITVIGKKFGPYLVVDKLGEGGMGEVYRARDTRLGREVAIKIPPQVTADPDRRARFEREARLLAALNHPNIAAIYGFETFEDTHALVLELVAGETLAKRISRPRHRRAEGPGLTVSDALMIARQTADALEAAHEKGIIHRDLKPANIQITPEGTVKVLDFGVGKLAPPIDVASSATTAPSMDIDGTRHGRIVGTAAYMSPEQARGETVDKRTDNWSFGCVFYEMLTGHAAFQRSTLPETLVAILEREPDWPRPSLPASAVCCGDVWRKTRKAGCAISLTPVSRSRMARTTRNGRPLHPPAIVSAVCGSRGVRQFSPSRSSQRGGPAAEVRRRRQVVITHSQTRNSHASPTFLVPSGTLPFHLMASSSSSSRTRLGTPMYG